MRHSWSLLNHSRTGQGPRCANLHKWGLVTSELCDCRQGQTTNHIVDPCPITKSDSGLTRFHKDDWQKNTLATALTKQMELPHQSRKIVVCHNHLHLRLTEPSGTLYHQMFGCATLCQLLSVNRKLFYRHVHVTLTISSASESSVITALCTLYIIIIYYYLQRCERKLLLRYHIMSKLPFSSTVARPSARCLSRLNRSSLDRCARLIVSWVAIISTVNRF